MRLEFHWSNISRQSFCESPLHFDGTVFSGHDNGSESHTSSSAFLLSLSSSWHNTLNQRDDHQLRNMNTNSVLLITFCVFKSFIWNLVQGDRMRKKLLLRAHSTRSQQTINQDSLKKNHQNLFFFKWMHSYKYQNFCPLTSYSFLQQLPHDFSFICRL